MLNPASKYSDSQHCDRRPEALSFALRNGVGEPFLLRRRVAKAAVTVPGVKLSGPLASTPDCRHLGLIGGAIPLYLRAALAWETMNAAYGKSIGGLSFPGRDEVVPINWQMLSHSPQPALIVTKMPRRGKSTACAVISPAHSRPVGVNHICGSEQSSRDSSSQVLCGHDKNIETLACYRPATRLIGCDHVKTRPSQSCQSYWVMQTCSGE
nr:hypothetical protein CFP56_62188 [Quercus suber]